MGAVFIFLTPIVAIIFFVNCVALAKKIKSGNDDTANNTGWGAVMFCYLVTVFILTSTAS